MKPGVARRVRERQRARSRASWADVRRLRRDGHVGESVRAFADLAQRDLEETIQDLGGRDALSRAELTLVESAARLQTIELATFAHWVRTQDAEAARSVGALAARRVAIMGAIGLKRRERPVPSLEEYLRQRAQEPAGEPIAGGVEAEGVEAEEGAP